MFRQPASSHLNLINSNTKESSLGVSTTSQALAASQERSSQNLIGSTQYNSAFNYGMVGPYPNLCMPNYNYLTSFPPQHYMPFVNPNTSPIINDNILPVPPIDSTKVRSQPSSFNHSITSNPKTNFHQSINEQNTIPNTNVSSQENYLKLLCVSLQNQQSFQFLVEQNRSLIEKTDLITAALIRNDDINKGLREELEQTKKAIDILRTKVAQQEDNQNLTIQGTRQLKTTKNETILPQFGNIRKLNSFTSIIASASTDSSENTNKFSNSSKKRKLFHKAGPKQ